METITTIGLDIAKSVFQCMDQCGRRSGRTSAPQPRSRVGVLREAAALRGRH